LAAIQEAMSMVINNPRGTANFRLRGLTFKSAGKTGTAQSGSGEPHAWFIGYTQVAADTNLPDIAVAVIVENAGEGSDFAAPIFRALVETYYYGSWQARPWYASDFGQPTYTPTQFGGSPPTRP
jgi:penicillin-binding protein 2